MESMEYKSNMALKNLITIALFFLPALSACAHIYDGQTNAQIELNTVLDQVKPGSVLIIGEQHGLPAIHDQQMGILKELWNRGLKIAVGMEFFNYTDQKFIDQFRRNEISEDDFKKTINWGGADFSLYGPQLLFGEAGLGINMPRSVTSQISKQGLQSLTPEQQILMPPQFELGNEAYKRRFFEVMGGHVPPEKFVNYFAAQSVWDDTMAWQSLKFIENNPDYVFVIIVGEFHVAYGGGLPDRIKKRSLWELDVITISQIYTEGLSQDEIQQAIKPSEVDGKRADFIFLAQP